jgi:hypothetical protein
MSERLSCAIGALLQVHASTDPLLERLNGCSLFFRADGLRRRLYHITSQRRSRRSCPSRAAVAPRQSTGAGYSSDGGTIGNREAGRVRVLMARLL